MDERCRQVFDRAVKQADPYEAVRRALHAAGYSGGLYVIAVGKAAVPMANAAYDELGGRIESGVVLTKYGCLTGLRAAGFEAFEAGHPQTDEAGLRATERILELTCSLSASDTVIFLLSGGGSALFEKPLIPFDEYRRRVQELMLSGADITQLNRLRRSLSAVKAGRFAEHCRPAVVDTYALSDVLGSDPRTIASGPTVPDGPAEQGTPAGRYTIVGDVRLLCAAAAEAAKELGLVPEILTESLTGEASEVGVHLARLALARRGEGPLLLICGGETTVTVRGPGLGGRAQELVLAASREIDGCEGVTVFSAGSDGTDGPTDAAGAWADGASARRIRAAGYDIGDVLARNDSYTALKAVGALVMTGATGTNVNDLTLLSVV